MASITRINLTQQPQTSFEPISEITTNMVKFDLLTIAIEHDLFEHLQTPKTADALSAELRTNACLTAKLCNALTAMGFTLKQGSHYCNASISNTYLVRSSPYYQQLINRNAKTSPRLAFSKALKTGPSKSEAAYADVYSRDFIIAMAETAVRGRLQKTVAAITILPEFKDAKKLLDIGGGHGLYAMAFAQANPHLDAYVLDLPQVLESATKEYLSVYGMQDRVHMIPADFFTDDLGSDYDIIYASDVFYRATSEQRSAVLKKVASSLKRGGVFATRHWFLKADKSGPLNVVDFDLRLSSVTIYGDPEFGVFSLNEFIDLLSDAGFVLRDVVDIEESENSKLVIAERF